MLETAAKKVAMHILESQFLLGWDSYNYKADEVAPRKFAKTLDGEMPEWASRGAKIGLAFGSPLDLRPKELEGLV
eukprot:9503698-Pyramimonas_sp.AAC.1